MTEIFTGLVIIDLLTEIAVVACHRKVKKEKSNVPFIPGLGCK